MPEKKTKPRVRELTKYLPHAVVAGLAVAALAIPGRDSDPQGQSQAKPSLSQKGTFELGAPVKTETINGLEEGGKIDKVPILTLKPGMETSRTFAGKSEGTNDLVFIYSEVLSAKIAESGGQNPDKYGAGFLLTQSPAGVLESMVIFDPDTRKVEAIGAPLKIIDDKQRLFNEVYPDDVFGFSVQVEPSGEAPHEGVRIIVQPPQSHSGAAA